MAQPVFVLRPSPGLEATMERGRERGLAMVAMPLAHAGPVAWEIPASDTGDAFDGILLGSANGLRHIDRDRIRHLRHLPVFAVGDATARAARAHGFTVARTGQGGLQVLVDALSTTGPLHLLWLAGEDRVALDPPDAVRITAATTYRMAYRPLGEDDARSLAAGGVVLLHSGVAARHFDAECDRLGVMRGRISIAAFAPRIAESVSDGWKSLRVASAPEDGALLSLAEKMCQ